MTITGGTALSKDEIDRMVKEAESFAAEDHKRREAAEARNQADQMAYQVDKFLSENGDKVPDADSTELRSANDELKEALKDADATAETLRAATDTVMGVFQRVGQAMYQQQQTEASDAPETADGGGADAEGEATASGDDEVVEGEIVEEGGS